MKRLVVPVVFLIVLVGISFVISYWKSEDTKPVPDTIENYVITPEPITELKVTNQDNKSVDIVSDLNKPTLLTFWSSSCHVCGEALTQITSSNSTKYQKLFINLGDTQEQANAYLKEKNLNITTYYDLDKSVYLSWKPSVPSSYFIGKKTKLYVFPGQITKELLDNLDQSL